MMLQRQLLPNPRRPVHAFDSSGDPRSGNASKSSPFHNDNNEQLQGHPRRNTRNTSRRTRRRVRLACGACRTRKSRCDGSDPTCGGCRVHETECVYLPWKSRATVSQEYVEKLKQRVSVLQETLQSALRDGGHRDSTSLISHAPISKVQAAIGISDSSDVIRGPSTSRRDVRHRSSSTAATGSGGSETDDGRIDAYLDASITIPDQDSMPEAGKTRSPKLPDPKADPPKGWIEDDSDSEDNRRETDPDKPPEKCWEAQEGYFGESSTFAFIATIRSQKCGRDEASPNSTSSAHNGVPSQISSLIKDPKRYESEKSDLDDCLALPQRDLANCLVDAYFLYVDGLLPFIHEPTFRAKYNRTWLGSETEAADDQSLSWLAQLNLVFAFGCEYDHKSLSPEQARKSASRFFNRSKTILFADIFHAANLETMQTLLLMSHYMQSTTNINKCWSIAGLCIRMAHGMGLHLEPSRWNMGHVEREIRRRLWWGCYVVDRGLSLRYGRPPNCLERTADVRFPTPIDSEFLVDDVDEPHQPEGKPAQCHMFIAEIGFAGLLESVLREVYLESNDQEGSHNDGWRASRTPEKFNAVTRLWSDDPLYEQARLISTVTRLDGEIVGWQRTLPLHLRAGAEQLHLAVDWPFHRQRNVLYSKALTLRIILLRRTFLLFRRKWIEDDFQRSMIIACIHQCLKLSRELIQLFLDFQQQKMINMLWNDAHYLFVAVGMLVSLESLDESRRALVDGPVSREEDNEIVQRGINLLKLMGTQNSMVRRYIEPLEQILKEGHGAAKTSDSNTFGPTFTFDCSSTHSEEDIFTTDGAPPSMTGTGGWPDPFQRLGDNRPPWAFGVGEALDSSGIGLYSYPSNNFGPISDAPMLWEPFFLGSGARTIC